MSFFFVIKHFLARFSTKATPKERGTTLNRRASLYLNDAASTRIPYDDLWCSAVRCKLVHTRHTDLHTLWEVSNSGNVVPEIYPSMDEAYIAELKGVSRPHCFKTQYKDPNVGIDIYAWHSRDAIYMTIHMEPESEASVMKKQAKLCRIFNNVSVNSFFYKRLLSVIAHVISYLEDFKDKRHTLVVSGYSLGGIMAHIASAVFGMMFPNLYVKCHTFGSPKPGNDDFASWFLRCVNENYRITNGKDPIVYFPINYRWCHVERTTIHFDKNLRISISYQHTPWYRRFFLSRGILRTIVKKDYNRYDHDFDAYISRLWHYMRLTSYLYTVPEADTIEQSPI